MAYNSSPSRASARDPMLSRMDSVDVQVGPSYILPGQITNFWFPRSEHVLRGGVGDSLTTAPRLTAVVNKTNPHRSVFFHHTLSNYPRWPTAPQLIASSPIVDCYASSAIALTSHSSSISTRTCPFFFATDFSRPLHTVKTPSQNGLLMCLFQISISTHQPRQQSQCHQSQSSPSTNAALLGRRCYR